MIPGFGLIVCPDGSPLNIQLIPTSGEITLTGKYRIMIYVSLSKPWPVSEYLTVAYQGPNGIFGVLPIYSSIGDLMLNENWDFDYPGTYTLSLSTDNIPQSAKDSQLGGINIIGATEFQVIF